MSTKLILGDCLSILPTLGAGSVNAVVTDPPYNVGLEYIGYDDSRADYSEWCAKWLAELLRVCRGPVAISIGQANLSLWASIRPPTWWLAWWKPAAMGRCVVGFNNWEPIAVYGKPRRQGCDVIRAEIRPDDQLSGHPCPKPLTWALRQIEMLTEEGDIVLDPFMGSGTTGKACVLRGRDFIGVEHQPAYFAIAERRIREAENDAPLFDRLPQPALLPFDEVLP